MKWWIVCISYTLFCMALDLKYSSLNLWSQSRYWFVEYFNFTFIFNSERFVYTRNDSWIVAVKLFFVSFKSIKTTKIENVLFPFFCQIIFTGIALLLPYCSYLDIVEYMPSTRLTSRCHYYDSEVRIFIHIILERKKKVRKH